MIYEEAMERLHAMGNPAELEGQARYGITTENSLGIRVPQLRSLAREAGRDHELAAQLWASGVHEARLLATMVDDPKQVTEEQMESWVRDFDSWDVCDGCCGNLFVRTPFAYQKAMEWSEREEEYVKRAAFAQMAYLAVHDKKARDDAFLAFLPVIEREAGDNRNFVRKAVNWALRQIGKRNANLNHEAIAAARSISENGPRSAKWVASDALRELTSEVVQESVRKKSNV